MSPITVTLEVDSLEQEALVRRFLAFVQEMRQLALAAPEGEIIDVCEAAALSKGQDVTCQVLQQAVQERIQALEKKGRRYVPVLAAGSARIGARANARS